MRKDLIGFGEPMNENGFSGSSVRVQASRLAILGLVGLAFLGGKSVHGASVKRFALSPQQQRYFQVWSEYLAQGPQTWSSVRPPSFTPAVRSTIWQVIRNDTAQQQLENPMIDYLLWRRSLSPARFTANHPNLSPALAQLLIPQQLTPTPTVPELIPVPQTTVPPPEATPTPLVPPSPLAPPSPLVPPSPQTTSPQTVNPPAVPEPGSLLLAVGMVGWGLWWRRRLVQSVAG